METVSVRCLFFGVWQAGQAGHYLFTNNGRDSYDPALEWMRSLDSKLPPFGRQLTRLATLTHIHGWTALAMWDRTGDKRENSNSVFWVGDIVDFPTALAIARANFPRIVERIEAGGPITLCVEEALA